RRAAKSSGVPGVPGLGSLPEWNLADLYAGLDDPRITRDLDRGAAESLAFERDYKGKLAALADGPERGARLAEAIKRYEALDDLRREKPYQLEDRVEQLFHEKSVTGYSAWTRLFDETIAGLRFRVGAKVLAIEPALHLLQDPKEATRKAASEALAKTFKQNVRSFALITNVL